MPSWQDLEKRAPQPPTDAFAELCAQLLTTPLGRDFVKVLRAMTIEATLPASAPVSALRFLEGQRQFVHRIEAATERGLELMVKAKEVKAKE